MAEIIRYQHTEKSRTLAFLLAAMIVFTLLLFLLTEWNPVCIVVVVILLLTWWFFGSLSVLVSDRFLQIVFGPGLFKRKWNLEKIQDVEVVKNPWYYGIGIHFTPRGWLYNVSLPDAIEVKLKSGAIFRIGTNNPVALRDVILNAAEDVTKIKI